MRISPVGALVGGVVGAVARSAVVLYHLQDVARDMPAFLVPSGAIGLLVGAIAGASGRPMRGAAIGAVLSGLVFELFMTPLASFIGLFSHQAGADFLGHTIPYALQMAVAGALAGVVGGAIPCLRERADGGDLVDKSPAD